MADRFADKVAFVTGASSGLGAEAARTFARQGAKVALAARRAERLTGLAQKIEADGGTALAVPCDVCDRASLDAAVAKTVDTFGNLDVVLANAGFGVAGPAQKLDTPDFRRQFETNVFGLLDTVYAALPHLIAAKGRIGLVGSVSGRMASPATIAYTASKFAVVGLAESMYYDLAKLGVSVTCINPGFVASEIRSVNNHGVHTGKPDPIPRWLVYSAEKAGRKIAAGMYRRKPEVVITGHGAALIFMSRHFPRSTRFALRMSAGK